MRFSAAHGAALVGAILAATAPALAQPQPQLPRPQRLFDEATTLARSISDSRDREEAIARIAEARVRGRNYQAARQLLRSIGDADLRNETMENIALISAYADRFAEALRFARALQDEGRRAQTIGRIAREQARAGDFDGAQRTAREVTPIDAKVLTLAFISEIATRAGRPEVARNTMDDAMGALGQIPAGTLKDTMATIVAAARARAADFAGALEVARTVGVPEARAGALIEIATVAVSANARAAANDVADGLAAIARSGVSASDRVRLLVEAAQLKVRTGDTGGADTLVREATEAVPRIEGDAERSDGAARVAAAMVRADASAALAYARGIADRSGRDQALASVANALALSGRASEALALLSEIGEAPFRDDAFRRAILAMAGSNIQQALDAAEQAPPLLRNAIYVAIVEARSTANDPGSALLAAVKIEDMRIRDAALATATRTLARRHRNSVGARRVAERIQQRELREDLLVDVIDAEARDGNLQTALATARTIRDPQARSMALALVAARLNRPPVQ
jgi:hypothetical protein